LPKLYNVTLLAGHLKDVDAVVNFFVWKQYSKLVDNSWVSCCYYYV